MTIMQIVDIPADRRISLEVPPEMPAGRAVVAIAPAPAEEIHVPPPQTLRLPGSSARTVEEALQIAEAKARDPNRKPISRLFGTHKGILGGDGVAYQRAIRDECGEDSL